MHSLQRTKSTAAKVAIPKPVNLPSLKKEHSSSNDQEQASTWSRTAEDQSIVEKATWASSSSSPLPPNQLEHQRSRGFDRQDFPTLGSAAAPVHQQQTPPPRKYEPRTYDGSPWDEDDRGTHRARNSYTFSEEDRGEYSGHEADLFPPGPQKSSTSRGRLLPVQLPLDGGAKDRDYEKEAFNAELDRVTAQLKAKQQKPLPAADVAILDEKPKQAWKQLSIKSDSQAPLPETVNWDEEDRDDAREYERGTTRNGGQLWVPPKRILPRPAGLPPPPPRQSVTSEENHSEGAHARRPRGTRGRGGRGKLYQPNEATPAWGAMHSLPNDMANVRLKPPENFDTKLLEAEPLADIGDVLLPQDLSLELAVDIAPAPPPPRATSENLFQSDWGFKREGSNADLAAAVQSAFANGGNSFVPTGRAADWSAPISSLFEHTGMTNGFGSRTSLTNALPPGSTVNHTEVDRALPPPPPAGKPPPQDCY